MSKRKINKRQASRIQARQQNRLRGATTKVAHSEDEPLGPAQHGVIITRFGASVLVDNRHSPGQGQLCHLRQHLPEPVTGDEVLWHETAHQYGVVTAIQPRRTVLVRLDSAQQPKPLAANVSQMVIVFAGEPSPSSELIDRYLIACAMNKIQPLLVLNKADLPEGQPQAAELLNLYQSMGYPTLITSAATQTELNRLVHALKNHTSLFVGQSGVGKSSLIQAILPQQTLRIGAISDSSRLGKHTTSTATLYYLPAGGQLIDSPGVRNYRPPYLNRDTINLGYPEIGPLTQQCKFRNCSHQHEPQCAVQNALKSGTLHPLRVQNYLKLLAQADSLI